MRIGVGVETARHVLLRPNPAPFSVALAGSAGARRAMSCFQQDLWRQGRDDVSRCRRAKMDYQFKYFLKRLNSCSGAAACPAVMLTPFTSAPKWTPTAQPPPLLYWNKTFGQFSEKENLHIIRQEKLRQMLKVCICQLCMSPLKQLHVFPLVISWPRIPPRTYNGADFSLCFWCLKWIISTL